MKRLFKIATFTLLSATLLLISTLSAFADSGFSDASTQQPWTFSQGFDEIDAYIDGNVSQPQRNGLYAFTLDKNALRRGETIIMTYEDSLTVDSFDGGSRSLDATNEYIESTNYNYARISKVIEVGYNASNRNTKPQRLSMSQLYCTVADYKTANTSFPLFSFNALETPTTYFSDIVAQGRIAIGFTAFISTDGMSFYTQRIVTTPRVEAVIQENGLTRYDYFLDLSENMGIYVKNGKTLLMDVAVELSPDALNYFPVDQRCTLTTYSYLYNDTTTIISTTNQTLTLNALDEINDLFNITLEWNEESFNLYDFFSNAIGGFFSMEIAPGFSLGKIGLVAISIGLLFAILKYFAGG